MIRNIILALSILLCLSGTLQAGVDREFGEETSWWKASQNQFLNLFGIHKNYALVVGISNYNGSDFQSLPSEKDAVRIKDYLINEAGFDHVRLITGDQVSVEKIRKLMLDHYPALLGPKDRFLFYWSGHGVTTNDARKQGYLAVQNSQSRLVSSMLSMQDLSQWDRRMKAKQTLYLLDACFSGMAASKAMSVTQNQTIERVSRPSSQVLTAGLDDQQTIAISDMNGGVFTRALLDGLRGHTDTDKGPFKKDGVVTARELEIYARARVDHERLRVGWDKPITPVLYNFARHEGDFFFVHNKGILKKPKALRDGSASEVVATGMIVQPLKKKKTEEISPASPATSHSKSQSTKQNSNKRFQDNKDGTVYDTYLKATWQKCSLGQHGEACNGEPQKLTWDNAIAYTKKQSSWRLPTIKELQSLVLCQNGTSYRKAWDTGCEGGKSVSMKSKKSGPFINQDFFPNTAAVYWTSYSDQKGWTTHPRAWVVSFSAGKNYWTFREFDLPIRLIRTY